MHTHVAYMRTHIHIFTRIHMPVYRLTQRQPNGSSTRRTCRIMGKLIGIMKGVGEVGWMVVD